MWASFLFFSGCVFGVMHPPDKRQGRECVMIKEQGPICSRISVCVCVCVAACLEGGPVSCWLPRHTQRHTENDSASRGEHVASRGPNSTKKKMSSLSWAWRYFRLVCSVWSLLVLVQCKSDSFTEIKIHRKTEVLKVTILSADISRTIYLKHFVPKNITTFTAWAACGGRVAELCQL